MEQLLYLVLPKSERRNPIKLYMDRSRVIDFIGHSMDDVMDWLGPKTKDNLSWKFSKVVTLKLNIEVVK